MIIDREHERIIADAIQDLLFDLGYEQEQNLAGLVRATLLVTSDAPDSAIDEVVDLIQAGLDD